ncbi:MAG: HNH endonuclease [Ilumatobacteraceae bacterium]
MTGHQLDDLLALDVDALDTAGLRTVIAQVARWSGRLASFESRLRERQRTLLAGAGPATPPGSDGERPAPTPPPGMLDGLLGVSPAEGRRRDARADVLARIPALRELLEAGRISVEHVDQVANCGRNVHPDLAAAFWACAPEITALSSCSQPGALRRRLDAIVTRLAVAAGVDRAERRRQMTRLGHRLDPATGMGRIWGELDPDLYERFTAILERSVRGRTDAAAPSIDWIRAHALVDLMTAGAAAGSGASPVPAVSVLIDLDTLVTGLHDAGICEYADGMALDVATARQMACEANIIPIVLGGGRRLLDVGHSRRLATVAQRQALAAVHASCAIEGCTVPFDRCEIHHLDPWENGGRTDLANLIPLCSHDHHEVHRRESVLTMTDARTLIVTESDGSVTRHHPDRRPATDGDGDPDRSDVAA